MDTQTAIGWQQFLSGRLSTDVMGPSTTLDSPQQSSYFTEKPSKNMKAPNVHASNPSSFAVSTNAKTNSHNNAAESSYVAQTPRGPTHVSNQH
jgi:hypothetical protein